jgi:hypothetical protein
MFKVSFNKLKIKLNVLNDLVLADGELKWEQFNMEKEVFLEK